MSLQAKLNEQGLRFCFGRSKLFVLDAKGHTLGCYKTRAELTAFVDGISCGKRVAFETIKTRIYDTMTEGKP